MQAMPLKGGDNNLSEVFVLRNYTELTCLPQSVTQFGHSIDLCVKVGKLP